jgi:hypothetical protein
VTVPEIRLPVLPPREAQLWHRLLDLAELTNAPWTLIGGQMVLLHSLERGHVPPQISQDGDIIGNVRADPAALTSLAADLERLGFDLEAITPEGVGHRYVRDSDDVTVTIDLLAPEGLGSNTSLHTTRPARTLEVPGGTQALQRSGPVLVIHEGRVVALPRPSLLGAVVAKAAACGLGGDVSRHHRDLALLCAFVEDPFAMRDEFTRKDRQRLRYAAVLAEDDHPAWRLIPPVIRRQGQLAYRILAEHR